MPISIIEFYRKISQSIMQDRVNPAMAQCVVLQKS